MKILCDRIFDPRKRGWNDPFRVDILIMAPKLLLEPDTSTGDTGDSDMSLMDRLFQKRREQTPIGKESDNAKGGSPTVTSATPETPDFSTILNEIGQIEDIIGGDESGGQKDDLVTLDVKTGDLVKTLPNHLKAEKAIPDDPDMLVPIMIQNLFHQLAKGKITARLADLVTDIPENLLASDYGDHLADEINVPLPLVVGALSPDALKRRTATVEREPDIYAMPAIFRQGEDTKPAPSTLPKTAEEPIAVPPAAADQEPVSSLEQAPIPSPETPSLLATPPTEPRTPAEPVVLEPEPAAPNAEEGTAEQSPTAIPLPSAEPVAPPAVHDQSIPAGAVESILIDDIDLNSATPRDMSRRWPGIGPALASRIVARRPFRTIFELADVPGIGPRLFQRLTGMQALKSSVSTNHIEEILGSSSDSLPPIREVAQRIAAISGINGCILSQEDGYVLASAWRRGEGQALGAIAPQIFKQIGKYFDVLHMPGPRSITLFMPTQPVFVTRHQDIFLIAFLPHSRFSIRRIELMEAIACELVRRLHRHTHER